jgi:hypothetical protein
VETARRRTVPGEVQLMLHLQRELSYTMTLICKPSQGFRAAPVLLCHRDTARLHSLLFCLTY